MALLLMAANAASAAAAIFVSDAAYSCVTDSQSSSEAGRHVICSSLHICIQTMNEAHFCDLRSCEILDYMR